MKSRQNKMKIEFDLTELHGLFAIREKIEVETTTKNPQATTRK